jgi:hypothetical protein
VRVLDVRVDIPDFGPIPGVFQERFGDIPKGVTDLDDVFVGVSLGQGRRLVNELEFGFVGSGFGVTALRGLVVRVAR